MWKFVRIQLNGRSPMQEILAKASSPRNLRLAIYGLGVNHIECAVDERDASVLALSRDVVEQIKRETRGNEHAILAYDMQTRNVYLVECTPELNAASAVLICVVSEMVGAAMPMPSQTPIFGDWEKSDADDEDWDDVDEDEDDDDDSHWMPAPEVVRRDARGRFVPKNAVERRPCPSNDATNGLLNRRFHLGRKH